MVLKKTDVCELLGIEYPIVQAPMGPFITTKLCAAVSNAGGLGTISHTGTFVYLKERDPEFFKQVYNFAPKLVDSVFQMEKELGVNTLEELRKVNKLTDKPFAVNVRVAREQPDAPYLIDAIIEEREKNPKLAKNLNAVITSAGSPSLYTQKMKDAGLKVIHVVPSVYHALKSEKAGVDAMVASGHEAGGHIAWDLGAGAIYMGTRFIATKESDFAQGYKEAVLKGKERDTTVTAGLFGPMRVLKNEYSLKVEKLLESVAGSFEEKANNPRIVDAKTEVSWADSYKYGKTENAPVLTGEVQTLVDDLPTVKELMDRIIREAEEIITKKLPSFIA